MLPMYPVAGLIFVPMMMHWHLSGILRAKWKGLVWRDNYPTQKDLLEIFDRGDVLLSAGLVASALQVLRRKKADYNACLIKTNARNLSLSEQNLLITHKNLGFLLGSQVGIMKTTNSTLPCKSINVLSEMDLDRDTLIFSLASLSYGLDRSLQELGGVCESELNLVVVFIMAFAKSCENEDGEDDRIIENTNFRIPETFAEVTQYVQGEIELTGDLVRGTMATLIESLETAFRPRSWLIRFGRSILVRYTLQLALQVCDSTSRPGILLSIARLLQPLLLQLHEYLCPHLLTAAGTLRILQGPAAPCVLKNMTWQTRPGLPALYLASICAGHSLTANAQPAPPRGAARMSLFSAVLDRLQCASLRARLAAASDGLPRHLGVIMDGNRRYAAEHRLPSGPSDGHRAGARNLLSLIAWCLSIGVPCATVWALSDDNLRRGPTEVAALLELVATFLDEAARGRPFLAAYGVRVRVVGDLALLPADVQARARRLNAAEPARPAALNLQIAVGYGGQSEALAAVRAAVAAVALRDGVAEDEALRRVAPGDVDAHTCAGQLGLPPIDAILRTGGERRTSGFALWECRGAELTFVQEHWPAFGRAAFLRCILDLAQRQRRHGL